MALVDGRDHYPGNDPPVECPAGQNPSGGQYRFVEGERAAVFTQAAALRPAVVIIAMPADHTAGIITGQARLATGHDA